MMQPPASGGEQQHHYQPHPAAQPWMAMQYPAAATAIAMQHQMMGVVPPPAAAAAAQYASRYFPYQIPTPQFHQHAAAAAAGGLGPSSGEENKSIWVGDLLYWMDENYLHSCFGQTGEYSNFGTKGRRRKEGRKRAMFTGVSWNIGQNDILHGQVLLWHQSFPAACVIP